MKKKGGIARYTAEEISAMLARGESRTDWAAVKAMTEEELEASIAADPDDVHEPIDWTQTVEGMPPFSMTSRPRLRADPDDVHECIDWTQTVEGLPPRKRDSHIRIDEDVLDWFRQAGRDYQTRINNVLRAFMKSRRRASR